MSDRLPEAPYRYSVREAAAYLGLSVKHLYAIAERREIDHLRTTAKVVRRVVRGEAKQVQKTGRLKFSKAGLDAWIEAHRSPARRTSSTAVAAPAPVELLPMPAVKRFG